MKRLLAFMIIAIIAYSTRDVWYEPTKETLASSVDSIQSWSNDTEISLSFEFIDDFLRAVIPVADEPERNESTPAELPQLTEPDEQLISIHNIELGDVRSTVEDEVGEAQRSTVNEYGLSWVTYHEDYQNFVMVAYDEEDVVRGLYTNQDLIASETNISYGVDQQTIRDTLGEPVTTIQKGSFSYQLNTEEEYDVYELDDSYITIFYDEHRDLTVTAVQVIDYTLEQSKERLYVEASADLLEGFEYQLFDLTNAARVVHELSPLSWDDEVRETSRRHSADMAENRYFSHTNLEGLSPFDRMQEDGIRFRTAGENLAYGQLSSIFAHEGLMNSLGHRENILNGSFERLGVGVAFNEDDQPYYTEKFLTRL